MYPVGRAGNIPNWNGGNGVKGHAALRLLKPTDPIGALHFNSRQLSFAGQPDLPYYKLAVVSHAHITLPLPVADPKKYPSSADPFRNCALSH